MTKEGSSAELFPVKPVTKMEKKISAWLRAAALNSFPRSAELLAVSPRTAAILDPPPKRIVWSMENRYKYREYWLAMLASLCRMVVGRVVDRYNDQIWREEYN